MEFNLKKKLLLFVFTLLFAAIMLVVTFCAFCIIPKSSTIALVEQLLNENAFRRILIGLAALLLAVCAFILLIGSFKDKKKERVIKLNSEDGSGSTFMSASAIDSIVQRCVSNKQFVRKCHTVVDDINDNESIVIKLKLTLSEEANMPKLCAVIRNDVKLHVQNITGVVVRDVVVSIVGTVAAAPVETERRLN